MAKTPSEMANDKRWKRVPTNGTNGGDSVSRYLSSIPSMSVEEQMKPGAVKGEAATAFANKPKAAKDHAADVPPGFQTSPPGTTQGLASPGAGNVGYKPTGLSGGSALSSSGGGGAKGGRGLFTATNTNTTTDTSPHRIHEGKRAARANVKFSRTGGAGGGGVSAIPSFSAGSGGSSGNTPRKTPSETRRDATINAFITNILRGF